MLTSAYKDYETFERACKSIKVQPFQSILTTKRKEWFIIEIKNAS